MLELQTADVDNDTSVIKITEIHIGIKRTQMKISS